jgi:hypothetical protein
VGEEEDEEENGQTIVIYVTKKIGSDDGVGSVWVFVFIVLGWFRPIRASWIKRKIWDCAGHSAFNRKPWSESSTKKGQAG